jgi:hypothetical protein
MIQYISRTNPPENKMSKNFALIDNCSGFVWYVGQAETPEAACSIADRETGNYSGSTVSQYEPAHRLDSNESGYIVFAAPNGFTVQDGQSDVEIAVVQTLPMIGKFRAIADD